MLKDEGAVRPAYRSWLVLFRISSASLHDPLALALPKASHPAAKQKSPALSVRGFVTPSGLPPLHSGIHFALALPKNLRAAKRRPWFFASVHLDEHVRPVSQMQKTLGICRGFL